MDEKPKEGVGGDSIPDWTDPTGKEWMLREGESLDELKVRAGYGPEKSGNPTGDKAKDGTFSPTEIETQEAIETTSVEEPKIDVNIVEEKKAPQVSEVVEPKTKEKDTRSEISF